MRILKPGQKLALYWLAGRENHYWMMRDFVTDIVRTYYDEFALELFAGATAGEIPPAILPTAPKLLRISGNKAERGKKPPVFTSCSPCNLTNF